MNKYIIILTILIVLFIFYKYKFSEEPKLLEQNFYKVEDTYPFLNNIYDNLEIFRNEIIQINNDKSWINWVEKNLYSEKDNMDWKIFPFFGFNIWAEEHCKKCPELTKFLKSIPGLKVAILSKMTPGTKLTEHKGWANHSNYVLRCHFNFIIPENCFISVGEYDKNNNIKREVKKYKQDKWIIFDDSRLHYTWNDGKSDRIVLILDIERPKNVKIGKATKGDTKELIDLINSFKNTK